MQAVINMAQALLEKGRELWGQDRYDEATRVLTNLLGFRVLAPKIAERAQFYLGDIHLAQGHYFKARRHLAAAVATGTDSGEVHFLLACALDWDDQADTDQAYHHYRKAVELEPGQPLYSSAYALTRIRRKAGQVRQDREALQRLRTAFAAAPDDVDIVYNYAAGLLDLGRALEAELVIRRARKRWSGHPAFEELWYQLLEQRNQNQLTRPEPGTRRPLRVISDDEPVVLMFPKVPQGPTGPKPLRPNAQLKTALDRLGSTELAQLARLLGLSPKARRSSIHQGLLNRAKLQRLLSKLSASGLFLIENINQAGGSVELRKLRLRLDAPHSHRPHSTPRKDRPLWELEQCGLVYLTTTPDRCRRPLAMIPRDLRKPLRDLVARPN